MLGQNVNSGKFKNQLIETKSVTLSASPQPQNLVIVPSYGDVFAFELDISVLATGTLSSAKTLDYGIQQVTIQTKNGDTIFQGIAGTDLLFLERMRNKGINRTIATISGSAQTDNFFIPLNIEMKDQEAKVQVTVAPYSALATSGATGGTVAYTSVFWYYSQTAKVTTEKILKITKTANIGVNSYGTDLPKSMTVTNILFTCTESYLSYIRFSSDGQKELDNLTIAMLTGIDNAILVSGHVSTYFSLYNAPFYCTPATALDFINTTADTINLYVIGLNGA